ncbi:MAG TPA: ABC transporter permease [Acidimicrobiales bacterium]|nr:ABC transporter permease [Acidimicrobiales bacterium]
MARLIAKRLVSMVVIVFILAAVMFLLQKLSHTSPVHAYLGANASPQAIARESKILGYDRPIPDQFVHYIWNLLHGNFGTSLRTRRPVRTDLATFLPATLELTVFGLFLAVVLGALLGVASAARWRGAGFFRLVMLSGASAPSFLLALLGILLFFNTLHWLPQVIGDTSYTNAPTGPTHMPVIDCLIHGDWAMEWNAWVMLLLPGVCVALGPAVSIGRVLRTSLVNNLRSDFVRTARAKGITERTVLFRHALRNSLNAALSMTGLQAGLMFAGVVVIETVFAWPGIGLYTDLAIPAADFPGISGVTIVLGIGYVVINTVVDILQSVADPRVALK